MIGVDHQPHVRPDGIAHGGDDFQVFLDVEADLDLDGMKAFGSVSGGFRGYVGHPLDTVLAERAGGIGAHRLAKAAAEEGGDRGTEMLALDVPQGDVDAAQRGDGQAPLALVAHQVVETDPQALRLQRITPQQGRRIGLDDGGVGQRGAEAFAPADGTVFAHDLHQAMLAPVETRRCTFESPVQLAVEKMGADSLDLHGR